MVLLVGQVGRDRADPRVGPLRLCGPLRAAHGILKLEDQPRPRVADLPEGGDHLGRRLAIGEVAAGIKKAHLAVVTRQPR